MANASEVLFEDTAPFLSVVYACLLFLFVLLSLTANIAVCMTIFSCSGLRTPLDFYILNLAIGDLVSSFFGTFTVDNVQLDWSLGVGFCKFTYYIIFVSFSLTVLTLCVMCMERYYGICRPLKHPNENLFRRHRFIIPITWLLSLLMFIPLLLAYNLEEVETTMGKTKEMCSETWSLESKKYYALIVVMIFIVAPCVLMAFLFTKIILKLDAPRSSSSGGSVILHKKRKAECKMLVVLFFIQFMCWTPALILKLLHNFEQTGSTYLKIWLFLELLHFLRAFLYPSVYYVMYASYRSNLRALLKSCFLGPARSKDSARNSVKKEPSSSSAPSETSMKYSSPPDYNSQFSENELSTAM